MKESQANIGGEDHMELLNVQGAIQADLVCDK